MRNLNQFLFLLVAAFASVAIFPSCGGGEGIITNVSGVVLDEAGAGLSGVNVYLTTDSSEFNMMTGADGSFSFTDIDGEGTLGFEGPSSDYTTLTKEIGAGEDDETIDLGNITLAFSASYHWKEDFAAAGNVVENPLTSTKTAMMVSDKDAYLTDVSFMGAVNPSAPWFANWSLYGEMFNAVVAGSDPATAIKPIPTGRPDVVVSGATGTVTWTKDNNYILDGRVYVESGATLTIEAGTVIKGRDDGGNPENAAVLIVARGGKIMAEGTASEPIIFTYEGDMGTATTSAPDNRGKWGGVILLGDAPSNNLTEKSIEGIPTSEGFGLYGSNGAGNGDANHNIGVFKYISIRHGGREIGEGNEINGLTLGCVGAGSTIEYVEVIGNVDDGIEWFGGTVNGKYLISAFCGDDGIDYDQGYDGVNQFVIVHQDDDAGDNGAEQDGGPSDNEDGQPYATPIFSNCTFIGRDGERVMRFRDNAGGFYYNSIFQGFGRGIYIEDLDEGQDSYNQFKENSNLRLQNNIFDAIGEDPIFIIG